MPARDFGHSALFEEFPEGHKEGYFARREKVGMPVAAFVRPRKNENRFEAYCLLSSRPL